MTDIAARREARRKRILENSESRLRRITSLHQDGVEDDKPKHNLSSEGLAPLLNSCNLIPENDESVKDDGKIGSIQYADKDISLEKAESTSLKDRTHRKWILMLIVLTFKTFIVLFANADIFHMKSAYINKIFMPFLLYEVIEIRALKLSINENSFISTLLFLSNIPHAYTMKIRTFVNILAVVMQDMFLYVFLFVVVEVCIFMSFGI